MPKLTFEVIERANAIRAAREREQREAQLLRSDKLRAEARKNKPVLRPWGGVVYNSAPTEKR